MTTASEDLEFLVEDEPDLTIPEDTLVRARLVDLRKRSFEWTDTKDRDNPGVPIKKVGESLNWWFEVVAGDYQGRKVRGETRPGLSNNPKNKFRQWAETLLGRELEVGARVHRDDLVGVECEISIKHVKDKKDPSKIYEEVDEVIPITGAFDFNSEPPF